MTPRAQLRSWIESNQDNMVPGITESIALDYMDINTRPLRDAYKAYMKKNQTVSEWQTAKARLLTEAKNLAKAIDSGLVNRI